MSEDRLRQQRPLDSLITTDDNPSQRSQEQHPSAHSAPQYGELSVARTASNTHQAPLAHHTPGHGRSLELPPLPQAPSATGGSFPCIQRSAGVSSILNPVADDEQQALRRKNPQLSTPPAGGPSLPPLNSSYPTSQSIASTPTVSSMSLVGSMGGSGERPPRRILTPRSPSLYRPASLSQLTQPSSATYSAQPAPFAVSPRSRSYAIEPGTGGAPPLPTPPAGLRHANYGFPAHTQPFQTSRPPGGAGPARFRHASESTSPRSSYSSYSQAASPATTGPSSMPTLSSAYPTTSESSAASGLSTSAPTSGDPDHQRSSGVPISSSSGQNVYQMMTLETTSGTVQLPVDVQAASRVADEKRRRNAGASARFRQRRKEKEKEASTTIGRLEQQVKELSEDLEFYKRERDYLAGVVLQVPGGDRHFPRPQSPRLRRAPGFGTSSSNAYMQSQMPDRPSPAEGRNVRRRTSTVSLPLPTQYSAYGQPHYGQAPNPQLPPPTHQLSGPASQPPQPSAHLMQAPPQTGPPPNSWHPYRDRQSSHQSRDSR